MENAKREGERGSSPQLGPDGKCERASVKTSFTKMLETHLLLQQ